MARWQRTGKPGTPASETSAGRDLAVLFRDLESSEAGLDAEDAARRLQRDGPNEPAPKRAGSGFFQLLLVFANPLVIILLVASVVSAALGQLLSASIIIVIVLLSVALNLVQTYRSQRAVERLRREVSPTATALRSGGWSDILRREIVRGDVIRLSAGDLVPADARLIEARDLYVQEAALTGESLPVEKKAVSSPAAGNAADASVYLGSSVVSGFGRALVYATGRSTAFGEVAVRLATRPPETEFERGARRFGALIMKTVVFLVLFVFLVSAVMGHRPLESLLFAIALAVGLTPEFLPMITTVTLSRGAIRMSRRHVIVKNLEAIQNLGSIDVLCSDKTGTLTSGQMEIAAQVGPFGEPSDRPLFLGYLASLFAAGVRNPVDTALQKPAVRSPLDAAILRQERPEVSAFEKVDEIPFDFERRRHSVVVSGPSGRLLIVKGAPESVLSSTAGYEEGEAFHPWDARSESRCRRVFEENCARGLRVLAVAWKEVPPQAAYGREDEEGTRLAGFLAFADPPIPDAEKTLRALHRDGVEVKILTGDNELVARHVCSEVGLRPGRIVLGEEIDRTGDTALGYVAERTSVFARVTPAQKNRIILALKHRGHVVGFLGDGINDAPSLHAADVGISVAGAVDVARDAAAVILLERSLRVLHDGIIEGRKAFGNVMKYLLMGTSSNFGNMFSMAAAFLFLPFLPMLPMQILLNNFLYDLAQVTIPTDTVDPGFIRKPRRWDVGVIRKFMLTIGPISSVYDFLTFYALLRIFHAGEALFHTGWFVESLATQTLVIFVIRTARNPFRSRPSRALSITTLAVVGAGTLLPFTPVGSLLGFVPLPAAFFLFLALAAGTYLLLVEVVKRRLMGTLFRPTAQALHATAG
jgi:P-type Mg2+ transporter